ncbi:hypothetical protein DPMN_117211 [Dreissena polymorpha]|uniref:Uncharacterized protein n=1 Tax=Dreissena polymorpha TaxID=45954 RepID=A0A9D4KQ83_DREPO|nr:hypothetical protein DPMN_117211 [Dreissena polymorpha]
MSHQPDQLPLSQKLGYQMQPAASQPDPPRNTSSLGGGSTSYRPRAYTGSGALWSLGKSPINVVTISKYLQLYPNKEVASVLSNGFKQGFKLGYKEAQAIFTDDLQQEANRLLDNSLAANTKKAYIVGLERFSEFKRQNGLSDAWPPTVEQQDYDLKGPTFALNPTSSGGKGTVG